MSPPYELQVIYRDGVERTVLVGDDLEALLKARDGGRDKTPPRSAHYRVVDKDDAERGDAEWCEECSERGAFRFGCEACG